MEYFVQESSIVRKIWGKSDTILFIFAGASAEFALNKAVDWLYFTGKLPKDPLGRLFTTVSYAKLIVFAKERDALAAIDKISHIHKAVENERGAQIPDWAYRDVLYMLIHYSVASFELLERKLTREEKDDLYDVFYRIGIRMQIPDLPKTYKAWLTDRKVHLEMDLLNGHLTKDLFNQYKKHLGVIRYQLLWEGQKLVVPETVKRLLNMGRFSFLVPLLKLYSLSKLLKGDWFLKSLLLPKAYMPQIKALDKVN